MAQLRLEAKLVDVEILQALIGIVASLESGLPNQQSFVLLKKHEERLKELESLYAFMKAERFSSLFFKWRSDRYPLPKGMLDRMALMSSCIKMTEVFMLLTKAFVEGSQKTIEGHQNRIASAEVLEKLAEIGKSWNKEL